MGAAQAAPIENKGRNPRGKPTSVPGLVQERLVVVKPALCARDQVKPRTTLAAGGSTATSIRS